MPEKFAGKVSETVPQDSSHAMVDLLREQISDLKAQLARAEERAEREAQERRDAQAEIVSLTKRVLLLSSPQTEAEPTGSK